MKLSGVLEPAYPDYAI